MGLSLSDILKAKHFLAPYNVRTPLRHYPNLSRDVGAEIHVKHENFNLSGAFKIRGGFYFVGNLPGDQRRRGIIAVTRGNHGLGLAIAGREFQTNVTIVVPKNNAVGKNTLVKSYGAELIEYGSDYDEAREYCEELVRTTRKVYVHTADEPKIIAAAGTCALEVFEDLPEADYLIVPIGGGGLISGSIIARNAVNPRTKIIGVQAENANAVYLSWRKGKRVSIESANTIADGVATRSTFELPFSHIMNGVEQIVTVAEDEIRMAIGDALWYTHSLVEGAAALTLAALTKLSHVFSRKKVVLIFTGGNIDHDVLMSAIEMRASRQGADVAC